MHMYCSSAIEFLTVVAVIVQIIAILCFMSHSSKLLFCSFSWHVTSRLRSEGDILQLSIQMNLFEMLLYIIDRVQMK